jgi:hypothetical protein
VRLLPSDCENLAGQDTGRRHLSHSRISVLLACPRKYQLNYVTALELVERPAPLSMGAAFQKGIELGNADAGVDALRAGAREAWGQDAIDEQRKRESTVRAAVELYLRRWPAGPGEKREVDFRVRLRNPKTGHYSHTFDLQGYADGVVDVQEWSPHPDGEQVRVSQPLHLIENKLVGQITPLKVRHLPLDQQCALMRYGLWRATGRPVTLVDYRWIKKPSIRQKQGETVDSYCERLEADYHERPDFYSHAETYYASSDDLLRIESELWRLAEMLRVQERSLYVRNTNHCMNYGGCVFMPICSGDPDAAALYQRKTTNDRLDRAPEGEPTT